MFAGRKGQRVVLSCQSATIDSRLSAGLQLFDAAGRELAAHRPQRHGDPVIDCTLPADGDYLVRLCEFTHAIGSPEHFYRLSISTLPWIDLVYPPMLEPGRTATVTAPERA